MTTPLVFSGFYLERVDICKFYLSRKSDSNKKEKTTEVCFCGEGHDYDIGHRKIVETVEKRLCHE